MAVTKTRKHRTIGTFSGARASVAWVFRESHDFSADVNHASSGPTHAYASLKHTRAATSSSSRGLRSSRLRLNLWNASLRPFPPTRTREPTNWVSALKFDVRNDRRSFSWKLPDLWDVFSAAVRKREILLDGAYSRYVWTIAWLEQTLNEAEFRNEQVEITLRRIWKIVTDIFDWQWETSEPQR